MSKAKKLLAALLLSVLAVITFATPAQATNYFNCPSGVACLWEHSNGGGYRLVISVGTYGYNTCWPMTTTHPLFHKATSGSADFGGGWDLFVGSTSTCNSWINYQVVKTSNFENWGGQPFNDWSASFAIIQYA